MSKTALKFVRRVLKMEISRKPLDSFAWPGGYPMYYVTSDCAALCPKCANDNIDRVRDEIKSPDRSDQFRIVSAQINEEDGMLYCENCSDRIESAYGED